MDPSISPTTSKRRIMVIFMLATILLVGAGIAWYLTRDTTTEAPQVTQHEDPKDETDPKTVCSSVVAEELKSDVRRMLSNQDARLLRGWLAGQVRVSIAASEKNDLVLPDQVVNDVSYLSSATAPWSFDVTTGTIEEYRKGFYGSFFPEGAYVGQSSDGYVVSFGFDACGKINQVFMSPSGELLLF